MKPLRARQQPPVPEITDVSELPGPADLPAHKFVSDPAAIQALVHPLRSRILLELMHPQTVSQIGQTLDMQPARVFYYVRGLEQVGLVKLIATRRYRGALEKYYQAVARSFDPDPSVTESPAAHDLIGDTVSSMLRRQHREARLALQARLERRKTGTESADGDPGLGLVATNRLVLTRAQMEHLLAQMRELIEQVAQADDGPDAQAYHLWVTAYPEADAGILPAEAGGAAARPTATAAGGEEGTT